VIKQQNSTHTHCYATQPLSAIKNSYKIYIKDISAESYMDVGLSNTREYKFPDVNLGHSTSTTGLGFNLNGGQKYKFGQVCEGFPNWERGKSGDTYELFLEEGKFYMKKNQNEKLLVHSDIPMNNYYYPAISIYSTATVTIE